MAFLGASSLHQHFEDNVVVCHWLAVPPSSLGLRMHPELELLCLGFTVSRHCIGVREHATLIFIPADMVMVLVDIRGLIEDEC